MFNGPVIFKFNVFLFSDHTRFGLFDGRDERGKGLLGEKGEQLLSAIISILVTHDHIHITAGYVEVILHHLQ